MLIEVDVTKPLPDIAKVKDPDGKTFDQQITYDWKPAYFSICLQIGHVCQNVNMKKQVLPAQNMKTTKQTTTWLRKNQNVGAGEVNICGLEEGQTSKVQRQTVTTQTQGKINEPAVGQSCKTRAQAIITSKQEQEKGWQ